MIKDTNKYDLDLFKCQKIRDENKENLDDEDNDSWALPSPTLQLLSQLPSQLGMAMVTVITGHDQLITMTDIGRSNALTDHLTNHFN
ncbi:hypothetical protein RirG_007370 [Rhizophagus irregularis DAOM 197198w]|uniref:Uncharacterized protein n=1 Tax=Rhizophagus irregularis (strain DAOM 197198w) TaxID=1432141 RepID=A0A015NIK0_RHIIW|nr:hypothetical protein RirG_007370 [Rhizophagus irregularis DAOM 197198w]